MKCSIIVNPENLVLHFTRLCKIHQKLRFAVAWCGDPSEGFPYSYLRYLKGRISAAVGIDFYHSHPKGLQVLAHLCSHLRIASNPKGVFHPKVFLFESPKKVALLVGSANFTKTGFSTNDEACLLIEGSRAELAEQFFVLQNRLDDWFSEDRSFLFSEDWLSAYRKSYNKIHRILRKKARKADPTADEQRKVAVTRFLANATWQDFFKRVQENRAADAAYSKKPEDNWTAVLEARVSVLPKKWEAKSFDDPNVRAFLFGSNPRNYGAFGHVGASGRFLKLLACSTTRKRQLMASAFNCICELELPRDQGKLLEELKTLCRLGPTMKVWGRILLLLRPDLYFTVSNYHLRHNMSEELGIHPEQLSTPEGYIQAVNKVRMTDWYNSPRPGSREEMFLWKHRAAFVDAILRDA